MTDGNRGIKGTGPYAHAREDMVYETPGDAAQRKRDQADAELEAKILSTVNKTLAPALEQLAEMTKALTENLTLPCLSASSPLKLLL